MPASEDQLKTWMVDGLNGDAAAYAALLKALVPTLRAFYRRRLGDEDAVEDLVQETLIAVHTRRMSYDRERMFSAWMFAVARYKLADHFRRRRQHCDLDAIDSLSSFGGFEEETNARMDLDTLLVELPAKQAGLIRKTRIEGQSIAEAAHEAGLGESDVKVSIHRGLKALALRLRGGR